MNRFEKKKKKVVDQPELTNLNQRTEKDRSTFLPHTVMSYSFISLSLLTSSPLISPTFPLYFLQTRFGFSVSWKCSSSPLLLGRKLCSFSGVIWMAHSWGCIPQFYFPKASTSFQHDKDLSCLTLGIKIYLCYRWQRKGQEQSKFLLYFSFLYCNTTLVPTRRGAQMKITHKWKVNSTKPMKKPTFVQLICLTLLSLDLRANRIINLQF